MKSINHHSFVNLYNKDKTIFTTLLKGTNTLSKLSNRITKLSSDFQKLSYENSEKLKGDLFEIFAESFFKILSSDNRIGVYDYKPTPSIDDYGVDGVGIGMNELPLTIQVKFRSDPTTLLLQEDLNQFAYQSLRKYRVDIDTKTNLVLFTNARGLHWATESKVFLNGIRTIGYSEISQLIDNNSVFWKEFKDMIDNTISIKYKI
jgi:hypothetical protein